MVEMEWVDEYCCVLLIARDVLELFCIDHYGIELNGVDAMLEVKKENCAR